MKRRVFPLLNIELIGINKADQENGIRVNDPGNPGRTYISGKGLKFPVELSEKLNEKLADVINEAHKQISEMIDLLNDMLRKQGVEISLSMEEIINKHALKLIRERHIAKVLRIKVEELASGDREFGDLLEKIYGGEKSRKKRSDISGVEDELRARLLKSGAPAFVPEDERAFPGFGEIVEIIEASGGIPTYPALLDGAAGGFTEFESDKELLLQSLKERGITSIEFIPLRNSFEKLKAYATHFYDHGFVVSFGTEHNTSAMIPMTVSCKNGVPLDDSLMQISFNGAAFIAAHQYLVIKEGANYEPLNRTEMEKLGRAVIEYYFKALKT